MREPAATLEASIARDALERWMVELATVPAFFDPAPARAAIDLALAALAELEQGPAGSPLRPSMLDAAVERVAAARAALPAAERARPGAPGRDTLARGAALLAAVERALVELRGPVIDEAAHGAQSPADAPGAPGVGPLAAAGELPGVPSDFRASVGVPRLHSVVHARLTASDAIPVDADFDVSPWIHEEESWTGLDPEQALQAAQRSLERAGLSPSDLLAGDDAGLDEADPGLAHDPMALDERDAAATRAGGAADEEDVRRLARNAISEIGILGELLAARPGDAWSAGVPRFESRLVCALDALMALARPYYPRRTDPRAAWGPSRFDVVAELLSVAGDGFVVDPMRTFARTFVLCCIQGDDTLRAAVLALRQSHPYTHDAQRRAFVLAPHPGIAEAMSRLAMDENAVFARFALEVLHARREARFGTCAILLSSPSPLTRAAAARCLGVVAERAAASSLLTHVFSTEKDGRVAAAMAESLMLLDSPEGLALARDRLATSIDRTGPEAAAERAPWLRLLGLGGGREDGELLARALRDAPHEASALGWFGDPDTVDVLIEALARAERAATRAGEDASSLATGTFRTAAVAALHRITGGGPDPAPPGQAADGRRAVEPFALASAWLGFWQARRATFLKGRRYRFGQLFTPSAPLAELARPDVLVDVREDCAFEVAMLSGRPRMNVHAWSASQLAELDALRELFAASERPGAPVRLHAAGEWPAQRTGMRRS